MKGGRRQYCKCNKNTQRMGGTRRMDAIRSPYLMAYIPLSFFTPSACNTSGSRCCIPLQRAALGRLTASQTQASNYPRKVSRKRWISPTLQQHSLLVPQKRTNLYLETTRPRRAMQLQLFPTASDVGSLMKSIGRPVPTQWFSRQPPAVCRQPPP